MPTLDLLMARLAERGLPARYVGAGQPAGVDVSDITHDSRRVDTGSLFACLRGETFDGHRFAADAVGAGAVALLVDHELTSTETGADVAQLVVGDTRLALGPLAAAVLGDPSRELLTVGITGTNGKTTTSQMIARILEADGRPTGLVGTLSGTRTTPEAPELQHTLADFLVAGDRAAVLEVSSHALALHRVDGTHFDVAVFTNLGRDHLDLHGTEEAYFRAKASLFEHRFTERAVINVDDRHGSLLADTVRGGTVQVEEFSVADLDGVEVGAARHRYRWRGQQVEVPLGGAFNVSNSLAALTTTAAVGVEPSLAAAALADLPPVPGRFEVVVDGTVPEGPGFTVVVDYAHTPDGLEQLLESARTVAAGRTILVFGCGGERDEEKRPEMGAVAWRLADQVIVTSDNPRREDPERIIGDILAGVPEEYRAAVMTDADRRAAIGEAIASAGAGDVVLIAGKGHEQTQDLGTGTIEFDDRVVARDIVGSRS